MKIPIKSYIICIIVILAFYFLLISKRIKQNKEKDILTATKEKLNDEIKKIIPFYKTNKGLLRKLQNIENKVTIKITGNNGQNVSILSNGADNTDWEEDGPHYFFNLNNPSQIILNNRSISYKTGTKYLEITLDDKENTIEIIWNYTLTNLKWMFDHCDKIESIDFSNFNFSQVTDMKGLMSYCTKLKYVNFMNADCSKVENMESLFDRCSSLEKVDNSFITLNVKKINLMFYRCSSLTSLDLSKFYTPSITETNNAFSDCTNLETIELPNFNESQIKNDNYFQNLFENSNKLKYINLLNYEPALILFYNF